VWSAQRLELLAKILDRFQDVGVRRLFLRSLSWARVAGRFASPPNGSAWLAAFPLRDPQSPPSLGDTVAL
jgi:hypothetical protein